MRNSDYFDWKTEYNKFHDCYPNASSQPVIGITGNFGEKGCELAEGYYQSILKAGGTPLIIPPFEDKDALVNVVEHIDGLILSGGGDMNPLFVGEEPIPQLGSINCKRDLAELLLIKLAYNRQIPMLGICRGIQMLTVALGGSVYQDIYTQGTNQEYIKHSQNLDRTQPSHSVRICEDSTILRPLLGVRHFVNSFHHQAVKEPGEHLRICATAPDGVIEAVESSECKSILGVQWHPECFILNEDECMMPLFQWLINESSSFKAAKNIHNKILSLDSHCDTPMFFPENIHFDQRDPRILVDLHKMNEGHLDAAIMVAYLEQKERTDEAFEVAMHKADHILNQIEQMVSGNSMQIEIARTPLDLLRLKGIGKKAIMLGIENGYAIGKDLSLLQYFRNKGIVYMTLCHNGDNDICDSARGNGEHGGLSDFGVQVVKEMNDLGLMVDLSHASETTFYDTLKISRVPVVCSHSSCKALCDVPRNLSDAQMKALAEAGGVAQVTLYSGFLRKDGKATIYDAIDHLNHMVKIMGIEHVGIGTDFDGDGGIPGCASASELINFTRCLLAERYTEEEIGKIWGGNFLRVMQIAQDARIK
ncbi:MAG: gamma-glutamyl-gamma-aminobutyrate hydrolase family protein [Paraprevotella sp.]|nr:gamma-glutamyl-gamma-aminobutyrate hydrolase family protein [Paraprevotella sp.]